MNNKDEILAELRALRVDFGPIETEHKVFHTPANYFRDFPEEMAAVVKAMHTDTSFSIPVPAGPVFSVPENYFEDFAAGLLGKIKAMETVATGHYHPWSDESKVTPYQIPEGYFDQFGAELLHKLFKTEPVAAREIEELSPLLAGLKEKKTYSLPNGYFNSDAFAEKAKTTEAKTVIHPAVRSIRWAGWAAAAAVLIIFGMGGWHLLSPPAHVSGKPSIEQSLAKIPDARIEEWLSNNMDEYDINSLGSSIAGADILSTDISLRNFSDKDIRDYLEAEVW
jgi:hypothetical protein